MVVIMLNIISDELERKAPDSLFSEYKKAGLDVVFSYMLTNTSPHQLRWGDQEMGTAISCTECSQVTGLPCNR